MDFFKVKSRNVKQTIEIYPDFIAGPSKDLMIRARGFYAVWNEITGLWSTDEFDIQRIVDKALYDYANEHFPNNENISFKLMSSFDSGILAKYRKFLLNMPDNYHQLDNKIIFADSPVKKTDYASKRLSYNMQSGSMVAYDELMSVLYSQEERDKLEWAIGSILAGDSRFLQKFLVLYGESGSGKSTFLNIVQKLFEGYYVPFDAKALTGSSNSFSMEMFRHNPLVAIQHDGDLSKIEDNTKLNSIVSHEEMTMNEKYKPTYSARINCFLFMGTNRPVKISDSKSGIIRRLIDVHPSGNRVPTGKYNRLMERINFELGAIAHHCHQVYLRLGKNYYNAYRAQDMILQTNIFFNFVQENYHIFKRDDMVTLSQAYAMYKEFIEDYDYQFKANRTNFREELKSYFDNYWQFKRINDKQYRDLYRGFKSEKIDGSDFKKVDTDSGALEMKLTQSYFDTFCYDYQAQYANDTGTPMDKWNLVSTKLGDLDTSVLHYVKLPANHIVIDFDLKDESGNKSKELNILAASNWPVTYAEFSKSGEGIHLHYIYDGDVTKLKRLYSEGIEIKVFTGNSSLRRMLTYCNGESINHISNGLPVKGEKMIHISNVQSEQGLRKLITRNLNKEIHSGTKPSIDFIYKILEDAYSSELKYDVADMRNKVLTFAMNSTNNADYCVKLVNQMKFASEQRNESVDNIGDEIVFFDVEVFPNLFIVVYKAAGVDKQAIKLINPTSLEIEQLFKFKLVGFNCRRYDNHILYARYLGYTNEQLYELSQKIISSDQKNSGLFGEAYSLSYTDVYDFCSVKQSLKKWEIDLDIPHVELGYKWDERVPEDKWDIVAEYCVMDVLATEHVFNERQGDFIARQILADLSGGSVNDTTNALTTKLIFGNDKHPKLVYTDLATGEQS